MCNTLKHPRHNKPNWESFPSSTAYKEIFERWRPTFNKQKLTLDWSKNTSLKKVFATDIVHNLKFLGLCMQEWKRKKNCENEKRKKNVGGNKTTGWRSLSKTGWRTDALRLTGDVASGCGRLWFPDLSLKGLTSDASPHPCLHPSIHLFIHPSLPLSFLFAFGVNKFCFPLDPLEGPWSSHLFIQEIKKKNARNPSHVQDVEPCEGQCEDERTDRSKSGEETARTADRALTTENNRRGWKGCTESWKVVTASKEICDEWNEVEKMNLLFPPCKWWCNIHFYYILNNKKNLHFQLFWKDCYLMCQQIWATCTITVLLKWWKRKRLQ